MRDIPTLLGADAAAKLPNIMRWVKAIDERPAVKKALAAVDAVRARTTAFDKADPATLDKVFGRGAVRGGLSKLRCRGMTGGKYPRGSDGRPHPRWQARSLCREAAAERARMAAKTSLWPAPGCLFARHRVLSDFACYRVS